MADPSSRLLTITEAAARLGVSRWTLSRYINAGQVRAVRLNNRRRVPAAEIERVQSLWGESS